MKFDIPPLALGGGGGAGGAPPGGNGLGPLPIEGGGGGGILGGFPDGALGGGPCGGGGGGGGACDGASGLCGTPGAEVPFAAGGACGLLASGGLGLKYNCNCEIIHMYQYQLE